MEILILVLLYYLSQNPDFHESVKPLMGQLKNSEQMLSFLNDLSKFSQTFSSFQKKQEPKPDGEKPPQKDDCKQNVSDNKKPSESPTSGIADEFIQQILDSYLSKKQP